MTKPEANKVLCRRIGPGWACERTVTVRGPAGQFVHWAYNDLSTPAYTTLLVEWLFRRHHMNCDAFRDLRENLLGLVRGGTAETVARLIFNLGCQREGIEYEARAERTRAMTKDETELMKENAALRKKLLETNEMLDDVAGYICDGKNELDELRERAEKAEQTLRCIGSYDEDDDPKRLRYALDLHRKRNTDLRAENAALRQQLAKRTIHDAPEPAITGNTLAFLANDYSGDEHKVLWERVTALLSEVQLLNQQLAEAERAQGRPPSRVDDVIAEIREEAEHQDGNP